MVAERPRVVMHPTCTVFGLLRVKFNKLLIKRMKYNININQLALSEMSEDMDIIDAAILDYIIVMCNSLSDKIDDKRIKDKNTGTWTWIDLQSICEDMPLLRLKSRSSLTPRIARIEKNGFITVLRKRIKGHISLFVKLDRKVDSLFVKLDRPVRETGQESEKPVRETGPIIYTSNTIHNNTSTLSEVPPEIPESPLAISFKKVWQVYPLKKSKMVSERAWYKLNPSPELEQEIIKDIQKRTLADREWLGGYIPHLSTYLNQQRWTDEITPITGILKLDSSIPHTKGKYSNDKSIII